MTVHLTAKRPAAPPRPSESPTTTDPAEAPAPPVAGIGMTPKAVEMAKMKRDKRRTPDAALRVGLRGGGCSGFTYVLEFSDDPPRERDRVFDFDGLKVLVDPKSLVYLAGTVLDWEQTLMYQGFKFKNPHQATSCGCGQSFSVA
jgi:iron-sulfur cluster assembly protein